MGKLPDSLLILSMYQVTRGHLKVTGFDDRTQAGASRLTRQSPRHETSPTHGGEIWQGHLRARINIFLCICECDWGDWEFKSRYCEIGRICCLGFEEGFFRINQGMPQD